VTIRGAANCKEEPSLAVAHGGFWKSHPRRAYAWELRLGKEIGERFWIEEVGAREARNGFSKGITRKHARSRRWSVSGGIGRRGRRGRGNRCRGSGSRTTERREKTRGRVEPMIDNRTSRSGARWRR
jgi:hypothetical protein